MAKRKPGGKGNQGAGGAAAEKLEIGYRVGDFIPLFVRSQFEKTVVWLLSIVVATAAGVAGIYAVSLALSGQTDVLARVGVWLLLPVILLFITAGFAFYAAYVNARVLNNFYRQGGTKVGVRISESGIEVRSGHSLAQTTWQEAKRYDIRKSGLIVWKGPAVPIVLPARFMAPGQYARILALASAGTAKAKASDLPVTVPVSAQSPAIVAPGSSDSDEEDIENADVAPMPDFSDSEYRFGNDWVQGGIRFRFEVTSEDRNGLMEYSLVRPGSRYLLFALGLAAVGITVWLLLSYLSGDREVLAMNLLFSILSAGMAVLFLIAVIQPALFMRIIMHLPGNRKRHHDAVRKVFCVLSDGVMYAKTEGRVDRVSFSSFHEIIHYRKWLLLFKDRKTAYVIPLRYLDETTRRQVFDWFGDKIRTPRRADM